MNTSITTTKPVPSLTDRAVAFYAAALGGDRQAARRLMHEDLVLHVPGEHPLAGDHVGVDAFFTFTGCSNELTAGTQRMEVIDIMEGTDHVAAYVHVTATRPGHAPLDNLTIHLVRFEDGLVRDVRFHNWDDTAVSAFWS